MAKINFSSVTDFNDTRRHLNRLAAEVGEKATDVETNAANIATNTSNIATNTAAIDALELEHNWTGVTVGSGGILAALPYYIWNGSSFVLVPDRADSTAYVAGDFVKPTAGSRTGLIFECVTAGTSHTSAPGWGVGIGVDVSEGGASTVVWRARAGRTFETDADLTGTLKAGIPIRWRTAGATDFYGMIVAISSQYLAVTGTPLDVEDDTISKFEYGPASKIIKWIPHVPQRYGIEYTLPGGDVAHAPNTDLLSWKWPHTAAHCVRFGVWHREDSTVQNPSLQLTIAGNAVSYWCNNGTFTGIKGTAATWVDSWTNLVYLNMDVAADDLIALRITEHVDGATAGNMAKDLTALACFVLE